MGGSPVRHARARWILPGAALCLAVLASSACTSGRRLAAAPVATATPAAAATSGTAATSVTAVRHVPCEAPREVHRVVSRGPAHRPSLTEVRARVLDGANLTVAADVIRQAEARGRVRQAGLSPNPYVLFRKLFVRDFDFAGTGITELEIGQPFELGGKRRARVCQARAEAARVTAEVRAKIAATLLDAEQKYYRALRLQEDVAQARDEEQATKELEGLAQARYDTGKDSRFAALRLAAQARDAHFTVQDLERRHARACRALDEVLGLPSRTIEGVEGHWSTATLTAFDRGTAMQALACHPRRRAADRALNEACRGIDRADADAWPDVTVGVAGQRNEDSDENTVGVRVHVPLPVRNRNEGARVEARAIARRARKLQEAETLKLATELDAAWEAYEQHRTSATGYATEILPPLETAMTLARQAYDAGRTPYLDVLDALIALIRARRARFGHLEEQAIAAAEIRYLTGM